jgi:hypothetical protein
MPHFVCNQDGHHGAEIDRAVLDHSGNDHGQLVFFRGLTQPLGRGNDSVTRGEPRGEDADARRQKKSDRDGMGTN